MCVSVTVVSISLIRLSVKDVWFEIVFIKALVYTAELSKGNYVIEIKRLVETFLLLCLNKK